MLRLLLPLLLAALAILTACSDDPDEELPANSASPTASPAGDVIFCPQIGVPGEATPSSPTLEPSCEPGSDFMQIAPNIRGRLSDPPDLPPGLIAATRFIEFETDTAETGAQIGVPLLVDSVVGRSPAWYSYVDGTWQKLEVVPTIRQSTHPEQQSMSEGNFEPLPPNLILLVEE